jgi:transposase
MAQQTDPTTLGDLWRMIERDSNLTREQVRREIDDVKGRLQSFVTRDHFEAEKRLLEARIDHLEQVVERWEQEAEEQARSTAAQADSRRQSRREFVYKGIIPVLALVIAVVSIVASR